MGGARISPITQTTNCTMLRFSEDCELLGACHLFIFQWEDAMKEKDQLEKSAFPLTLILLRSVNTHCGEFWNFLSTDHSCSEHARVLPLQYPKDGIRGKQDAIVSTEGHHALNGGGHWNVRWVCQFPFFNFLLLMNQNFLYPVERESSKPMSSDIFWVKELHPTQRRG